MANIKQPFAYQHPMIAVDDVIFTIDGSQLLVLLIQSTKAQFKGMWALPGGMVQPNESVDDAASRHLKEKTGVKDVYLEQLYTFGDVSRDPFGRVVSVAYLALMPNRFLDLKTTNLYTGIDWFSATKPPALAYDHKQILLLAIQRLKAKLEYSTIAFSLLPKEFTLRQLQNVYETVLGHEIDKRNFRKKISELKLVVPTGKQERGTPNRPAELYKATSTKTRVIQIL